MFLMTVGETGYGAAFRDCTVFLFPGDSQRFFADFFHDLQDFFCIRDIDDADCGKADIHRDMLHTVFIHRAVMDFNPLDQCVDQSGGSSFKSVHSPMALRN